MAHSYAAVICYYETSVLTVKLRGRRVVEASGPQTVYKNQ
jgi:hypothetical protein